MPSTPLGPTQVHTCQKLTIKQLRIQLPAKQAQFLPISQGQVQTAYTLFFISAWKCGKVQEAIF